MLTVETALFNHLLDLGGDLFLLALGLAGGFALTVRLGFFFPLAAGPFRRVFQFNLATLGLVGLLALLLLGTAGLLLVRQTGFHQLFLQGVGHVALQTQRRFWVNGEAGAAPSRGWARWNRVS